MFKKMLVSLDGSSLSEEMLPIEVPHGTVRRRRAVLRPLPPAPFAGAPAVIPPTPLADAETKGQAVEREEHELPAYLQLGLRPRRRVRREQGQRSGPARHPTGLEAQ